MRDLTLKVKKKSSIGKIIILSVILLIALVSLVYFFKVDNLVFKGPKTVVQLITNQGLKNDNGRINVLILGIGGEGHDGPNLTDTMIVASIDKDSKDVALISIPRDLWDSDLKAKINSAYTYGQENNGQGLVATSKTVTRLLGIPIEYAFRIDFNGFVKAVDLVGGLNIDVDNSFQDPKYPITGKDDDLCGLTIETQSINGQQVQVVKDASGSATLLSDITEQNDPFTCRYENLVFKKGPTQMDGMTALKYVRSRHGTNGEGSDFARSARQQKVILALREKVLSQKTLTNPKKIIDLMSTFSQSIDTNITNDDVPLFANLLTKVDPANIRRVVLDASMPDSKLQVGEGPEYGGQYVVVPLDNDWTKLGQFLHDEIYNSTQTKQK